MVESLSAAQQQVAQFLDDNEMRAPPEYRLLDLAAEVGEVAADAANRASTATPLRR